MAKPQMIHPPQRSKYTRIITRIITQWGKKGFKNVILRNDFKTISMFNVYDLALNLFGGGSKRFTLLFICVLLFFTLVGSGYSFMISK